MARLLIIAHAPLASALKAVAAHTFPEQAEQLGIIDVWPDMAPEAIEAQARALLPSEDDEDDPEALVMTDVFGATPCNVAQRLADGQRVRAVAGINVPMLWRTISYASLCSLDDLFERAVQGGMRGVQSVISTRPQNQALSPRRHGSPEDHHQQ